MSQLRKDCEIATRGIEALSLSLGPARTHRFLTLLRPRPADYVKISRRIYAEETVDEIFERSQKRAR